MKKQKYLLLAALCLLTLSNAEIAKAGIYDVSLILGLQEPPQPQTAVDISRQETEWMKKELALTPAQLPAVDSLNYAFAQKMVDVRKNNADDRDKRRSEMMALRDQKRTSLSKILTSEQMTLFDKAIKERREKMGNRPPRN